MSDNAQHPSGAQEPKDPWAPPGQKVPLDKPQVPPRAPAHDQPTVAAVPGAGGQGTGPGQPGYGQQGPGQPGAAPPGFVPPPPIAPNGPGQGPPGAYAYPAYPGAGQVPGQPAPYGGYPGYPGYGAQGGWNTVQQGPANGFGVAALVLGIVGVVIFCAWGLGIIIGGLALIFGILGRKRVQRGEANNGGMALAGIILGPIAMVIGAVVISLYIWAIAHTHSHDSDPYDYGDDSSYSSALVIDAPR